MEMSICMGINRKPWLPPTIYANLQSFVEFKEYFHHVFIKVRKDPTNTWHNLSYLATDDAIFAILESWPPKWCTPTSSMVETNKSATQHKKEEKKFQMAQLAEKGIKEEVEAKAQAVRNTVKLAKQQKIGGEAREGQKSPSLETEVETQIENGGADPQTKSTQLKHPCPQEKAASRKKNKASKTSLDPITLTEVDLHDIGETVRDVTTKGLQQFKEQQQLVMGAL